MLRSSIFLLVLGASLSLASTAHALGPIDVEVGAKVGAGSNPIGNGFPNPLGVGVGGRAGVAISGLYAGISAMDYVGSSAQRIDVVEGTSYEQGSVSPHSFLYGAELGYGRKLGGLVLLRAQVGVGDDVLGMGGGVGIGTTLDNIIVPALAVPSRNYLYVEPGVVALIQLGVIYVGLDVSALLLPSGPSARTPYGALSPATAPFSTSHALDAALTAHGQLGVRF